MPDAYQRLLLDAILGDASLFARSDEVEQAWRIIDPIITAWKSPQRQRFRSTNPACGDRHLRSSGSHPTAANGLTSALSSNNPPSLRALREGRAEGEGRETVNNSERISSERNSLTSCEKSPRRGKTLDSSCKPASVRAKPTLPSGVEPQAREGNC